MIQYSVIIPVYNCINSLELCVQSILDAQIRDVEILLIDDGSTDGSSELCDVLAVKHAAIHTIHQKNSGASAARNHGLAEANGKWILFADGDDLLDSNALCSLLNASDQWTDADLVIFGLSMDFLYKSRIYRREVFASPDTGLMEEDEWTEKLTMLFDHNYLTPVWNKIFRTDLIRVHQLFFSEEMISHEDMEFCLRYLACCTQVYLSDQVIYHYRVVEEHEINRMKRMQSLTGMLDQLEAAFDSLAARHKNALPAKEMILKCCLYLTREKIYACSAEEAGQICDDFITWWHKHESQFPAQDSQFFLALLERNSAFLLRKAKTTRMRHRLAVWLKAHGLIRA